MGEGRIGVDCVGVGTEGGYKVWVQHVGAECRYTVWVLSVGAECGCRV